MSATVSNFFTTQLDTFTKYPFYWVAKEIDRMKDDQENFRDDLFVKNYHPEIESQRSNFIRDSKEEVREDLSILTGTELNAYNNMVNHYLDHVVSQ